MTEHTGMALLADPLNNNWRSVHLHGHDRGASISFRMEWKRHPVALLGDIAFVQYLPWIYARDFAVALHVRINSKSNGILSARDRDPTCSVCPARRRIHRCTEPAAGFFFS